MRICRVDRQSGHVINIEITTPAWAAVLAADQSSFVVEAPDHVSVGWVFDGVSFHEPNAERESRPEDIRVTVDIDPAAIVIPVLPEAAFTEPAAGDKP